MALKGFVDNARQTNKLIEQKLKIKKEQGFGQNSIIDISDGKSIPKEKLEILQNNPSNNVSKENFTYGKKVGSPNFENNSINPAPINSSKNQTNFEKEYLKRKRETSFNSNQPKFNSQKVEKRHCNIIANVIQQSENKSSVKVPWQDCKHLKKDGQLKYCKEYHCFCKEDACSFSCK